MPNLILSGEIGYDVTSQYVREQINAIPKGNDLDAHIASPGGYLYPGIEIYNLLRDFKRNNFNSQMLITMKSWVMSMASYITTVEGADLVAVEDNVVFMLHNPVMLGSGDYRDHLKNGEYLKSLADIMAISYARRSGKSIKEIKEMMDEETYFYGEEIVGAGFADTVIETKQEKNKAGSIAEARINIKALYDKMKNSQAGEDIERIAALFDQDTRSYSIIIPENPYSNEHSARLRDPGDFAEDPAWQDGKKGKFRRTTTKEYQGKKASKEFDVIWGKLKGKSEKDDPPIGQAIRFKKDKWSVSEAKKWLKDNNIKYILFEAAGNKSDQAINPDTGDNNTASGGNNPEVIMDKKELQKNHADLYAEVIEAGKAEEKERVSKLMAMKKKPEFAKIPAVCEAIDKAISEGTSPEETTASVIAILANPNIQAAIESPDAIATGQEEATGSGEENTDDVPSTMEV